MEVVVGKEVVVTGAGVVVVTGAGVVVVTGAAVVVVTGAAVVVVTGAGAGEVIYHTSSPNGGIGVSSVLSPKTVIFQQGPVSWIRAQYPSVPPVQ